MHAYFYGYIFSIYIYGKYENRLNKYTKCFNFKIIINMIYYIGLVYIYFRNSNLLCSNKCVKYWRMEIWEWSQNWWEECVLFIVEIKGLATSAASHKVGQSESIFC
jgi:biotin transporter BioY